MRPALIPVFATLVACRPSGDSTPPPQPQTTAPSSGAVDPPPQTPVTVATDPKPELERAAAQFLNASPCIEAAQKKSGLYTPVVIRAEIAPDGTVAKILGVEHSPDRKSFAECLEAALRSHTLQRTDGGGAIEIGITISLVAPSGRLDKDIIRRVVRSHIKEVRRCYEAGLARDATLKGRVSITFTISPTGSVAATEVSESTMKDAAVAPCIAAEVMTWTFPEPEGGGNVVVTYPFVLESG